MERLVGAMAERPGDDKFQRAANRVIANLVDKETVKELTLDLVEASKDVKNKRKNLNALTKKLLTVALVAQIGNNADIVTKHGGVDAFVNVITTLSGFKNTEAKRKCLDAAINGLGLLTKKVDAKTYRAAVRRVFFFFFTISYRSLEHKTQTPTPNTNRYPSCSKRSATRRIPKHFCVSLVSLRMMRFVT